MRLLGEEETEQYVNFFRGYYPMPNFKVSVGIAKREGFDKFFKWCMINMHILQQTLNDKKFMKKAIAKGIFKEVNIKQQTHGCQHDTLSVKELESETKQTCGYFCQTTYIKIFADRETDKTNKKILMALVEAIKDSRWFIIFRDRMHTRPSFNLTDREAFLLKLFHEILHIIEVEAKTPIFRGSSIQDEIRDDKEIILPYVRLYIKNNGAW